MGKMTAGQALEALAAFHINSESGLHLLSVLRQALSAPRVPDIASMIDGFEDVEFVRRHGNSLRQCLAVVNDMDPQELRDLVVEYWGIANKLLTASPEPKCKLCNDSGYVGSGQDGVIGTAPCYMCKQADALLTASPEPVAQTIERDSGTLTVDETGAVSKMEPKRYEDTQAASGIPAENIQHDLDAALDRIMTGNDENGDVTFIRSAFKAWAESAAAERDLRAEVEALKAKLAEWAGEAYDDVGSWAAYAEQYFQNKHGLSDDLDKWAARKSGKAIDADRLREGGE